MGVAVADSPYLSAVHQPPACEVTPRHPLPLAGRGAEDLDFLVVRENNEGEYSNMGGRIYEGTEQDMAIQNTVFTRTGVERVLRYAFQVARDQGRRRRLTAATKSNGINYTMPFWDEYVRKIQQEFPDVETSLVHIDALAAFLSPNRTPSMWWWPPTCSEIS